MDSVRLTGLSMKMEGVEPFLAATKVTEMWTGGLDLVLRAMVLYSEKNSKIISKLNMNNKDKNRKNEMVLLTRIGEDEITSRMVYLD